MKDPGLIPRRGYFSLEFLLMRKWTKWWRTTRTTTTLVNLWSLAYGRRQKCSPTRRRDWGPIGTSRPCLLPRARTTASSASRFRLRGPEALLLGSNRPLQPFGLFVHRGKKSISANFHFFEDGPFPALSLFLSFLLYNWYNKFCLCLHSNCRSLVPEATDIPTEPQPLPKCHFLSQLNSPCIGSPGTRPNVLSETRYHLNRA